MATVENVNIEINQKLLDEIKQLQADKAEMIEALRDTLYHYDGTPLWLIEKVEQLLSKHSPE